MSQPSEDGITELGKCILPDSFACDDRDAATALNGQYSATDRDVMFFSVTTETVRVVKKSA